MLIIVYVSTEQTFDLRKGKQYDKGTGKNNRSDKKRTSSL